MLWGGGKLLDSSYTVERNELITLDEDVIFGGVLEGHFGHFMVECLCRLWYVIQRPKSNLKIIFIPAKFGGYHSWFDDFFRLMNIDKERIIYVDKPTQYRSVTIPEQSEYNPWAGTIKFSKEFLLPYQAIKSRVKPSEFKKLYLTRTNFNLIGTPRKCVNENYFEDFFAERGFEVIAPEKFSVEEQISLIMGADEIVATLGTLTHWAIFCKPTVKLIILARDSKLSWIQIFINEVFDIDHYYVVEIFKNFMYAKHENGVFLLGSNKYWKEFVADYFGEQIEEDNDTKYLEESLDKYVELWCRKYQNPKNIDIWIKSLSDMCHRIVDLERATRKDTKHLKKFVADYFGEQIEADDDTKYLEESLDKYVELWCREHQDPQNFDIRVKFLSGMCRRIIELERELRENPPLLSYQTHVDKKGWGDGWTDENKISNPLDKKRDIQAIKIDFPNHNVYYSVYFN